jgi:hypothetical protein
MFIPKQCAWKMYKVQDVTLATDPDSDTGRTGKDFPKYGTPGSILSGHKLWPLPAHVMISSHFLHNEVSPASNFVCNILINGKIIKEMPGSVARGTPCIIGYDIYVLQLGFHSVAVFLTLCTVDKEQ